MGKLTEAQRKWLEGLGVDTTAATPAPARAPTTPDPAPFDSGLFVAAPPVAKPYLDLNSPEMQKILMKGVQEQAEKDRLEAEQTLTEMNKALADVKAYVAGLPDAQLSKASYATIMAEVRKRFPQAAGLSQWVKQTAVKVPSLKGKLPAPQALMAVVESTVKSRGAELGWSLSTGKDLATVNTDRLLAAYMSELPAGVTARIAGGVVQLSLEGAAVTVKAAGAQVDATADKGGTSVVLKNDDFSIQVSNEGWSQFDPELRGQWQSIRDEATIVLNLKATRDKARLELEQQKKSGAELKADVSADFDKREAEFNLAWKKLQERVSVVAKASEQKISASVAYLKKDKNDKDSVKAGIDAELDLKAMQGKLQAYAKSQTVEAVLEVAVAADKVAAKLELTAVKSGVVVTAAFERALDETKAAIEVLLRDGKSTAAVELKKKADDLTAKIKLVHETKDLKLAAELEKTLKEVRGRIDVEVTRGKATVTVGADASSGGTVGGKAQIDIALRDGRTFVGEGDKLSFAAGVSTKGYKFEVTFSMGEPVETASLQDLFSDADRQIKELYRLAGDEGVRSIEDVNALNAKLQEVMSPVNAAAKKVKTLKKKADISASFGFSVEGEWPAGGKASPPTVTAGLTLHF